jgi:hypothetical protein
MVRFEKDGFTIHVHTGTNPVEEWMNLHDQLLDMIGTVDESSGTAPNDFYRVFMLLQDMMPDYLTAKKMTV